MARVGLRLMVGLVCLLLMASGGGGRAAWAYAPNEEGGAVPALTPGIAPPPLPRSCVGGATPTDYENPLCCVSGYVYLNGVPVEGATVTVTAPNGESVTTTTAQRPGAEHPYFTVSLDPAPLLVQPGEMITITASADGQSKTETFVVQSGGQQVDVVLLQNQVAGAWQHRELDPPYIYRSTMAYAMDDRSMVLVIPDYDDNVTETWRWRRTRWEELLPHVSPPLTYDSAMAYDAARGWAILFGGRDLSGVVQNETWGWDGTTWIQFHPALSPPARQGHKMVYDAARQVVVLFGGRTHTGVLLNDTWIWDGKNWSQLRPKDSPPPRNRFGMAYDRGRGVVVLYGGQSEFGGDYRDTWQWDGVNWYQRKTFENPGPLDQSDNQPMTYDGGSVILSNPEGMWRWDENEGRWLALGGSLGEEYIGLAYDETRHRVMGVGTYYTNTSYTRTWEWDGSAWLLLHDGISVSPPMQTYMVSAYEGDGRVLLFEGRGGSTYRWDGEAWIDLAPSMTPSARFGHRLAANATGSSLLLVGGFGATNSYLDDTWLWKNQAWQQCEPSTRPSARAFYALTYDSQREVWLLFGGRNGGGYLSDTWQFDEDTCIWQLLDSSTHPSPRSHATLTYDVSRDRAVLIGGSRASTLLDDVWEWNGESATWEERTPTHRPPARASHGAVYDSKRHVVVIAGGAESEGHSPGNWEWNGTFWRQHMAPAWGGLHTAMSYNPLLDELMVVGGERVSGDLVPGVRTYHVTDSPTDAPPVATIHRITPRDARRGSDTITFTGGGADADPSDTIVGYEWKLNGITLSTKPTFSTPANTFPLGIQVVTLRVQDDEGTWSPSVQQTLYIRDGEAGTGSGQSWTLLLYVVADNDLDPWLGDSPELNGMLHRLRTAGSQPGVQVGILYDGAGLGDTYRYVLGADGSWSGEPRGEARMDDMETLRDFVQWGYQHFTSDYYALALLDHANGVVGFGQDMSSGGSHPFLEPIEIRSALEIATDDGRHKLDVLHFDGCSFGLLENAAIADGLAHYIVASPNTAWGVFAHDSYRQRAGSAATPADYARAVAETYAAQLSVETLPHTISVFDMAYFGAVNDAVSQLGHAVLSYIQRDPPARMAQMRALRDASQKYDSGGLRPLELDVGDTYVDLTDLITHLEGAVTDSAVLSATAAVRQTLHGEKPFIAYEHHASGTFDYYDPAIRATRTFSVTLEGAWGVGVFYPPNATFIPTSAYHHYINHRLFPTTRDSGWARFLEEGLPPPSEDDPPALRDDELLDILLPPGVPTPPPEPTTLYLPLILQ